jgi:serine/threonine protein phosphatase PrpC
MTKNLEIAAATRTGRRRCLNADAYVCAEAEGLFAVADGMGDEPRSAEVAQRALETVRAALAPSPAVEDEALAKREAARRFQEALQHANRQLYDARRGPSDRTGTTFAGVLLTSAGACVAHVGDSRVLCLKRRPRALAQLTFDHTPLSEAVWRGVPRDLAATLPNAHALTRSLGLRPEVKVQPFVEPWELGDVLLLCTDGLTDCIEPHAIERLMLDIRDLAALAERLIQRISEVGGGDDVAVVLVRRII